MGSWALLSCPVAAKYLPMCRLNRCAVYMMHPADILAAQIETGVNWVKAPVTYERLHVPVCCYHAEHVSMSRSVRVEWKLWRNFGKMPRRVPEKSELIDRSAWTWRNCSGASPRFGVHF